MHTAHSLISTFTAVFILILFSGCQQSKEPPPNIIFFLADDLCWRYLGLKTRWRRDMFQVSGRYEVMNSASWRTYRTVIPTDEPLERLELNPLQGAKSVQIRSVELKDLKDQVLKAWHFRSS